MDTRGRSCNSLPTFLTHGKRLGSPLPVVSRKLHGESCAPETVVPCLLCSQEAVLSVRLRYPKHLSVRAGMGVWARTVRRTR